MKNVHSMAVVRCLAVSDTVAVPDTVETLFRRYHGKLMRFLSGRVRNDEDAADLAQETYGRLLRLQGERSGEDLRRMLFRIAKNLLNNHWRWQRVRRLDTQLSVDEIDIDSGEPGPERQLAGEQRLKQLRSVILAMPEKRRVVLVLSRFEGLSNPEIARRCGISVKTVEKHIAAALEECRAKVEKEASEVL
jgi:RNA polymerase sigma factor (sigma-70 family)